MKAGHKKKKRETETAGILGEKLLLTNNKDDVNIENSLVRRLKLQGPG